MNGAATSVYNDFSGLAQLKLQARQDSSGAREKVARQFESLFIQMMLKQMRQAGFGGGLMDSKQTQFVQQMYDQQLAVHLSEQRGMGMAELLQQHLGGASAQTQQTQGSGLQPYWHHPTLRANPAQVQPSRDEPDRAPMSRNATPRPVAPIESPESFVTELWDAALQAAEELGLEPKALLAQAALETGWGAHVMPNAEGAPSHNLFGIKADQRWGGSQVHKETLEFAGDVAVRRREHFRCYPSYEESFRDYVTFLRQNPRYGEALRSTHDSEAYFRALQDAGYATDPEYADKILRVMQGPEMQAALDGLKGPAKQPI